MEVSVSSIPWVDIAIAVVVVVVVVKSPLKSAYNLVVPSPIPHGALN